MNVYVPSRSRTERSLTLEALSFGKVPGARVWLAVPAGQAGAYGPLAARHGVQILPCPKLGIAATRHAIGLHAAKCGDAKFVMFDDDLRWFRRKSFEDKTLYRLTEGQMLTMLNITERGLNHYAHLAISPRQNNNQLPMPYVENRRPIRALGYQTAVFLKAKHGRVAIMEDFDVTLQLMRLGYKNCLITKYSQDQRQTQNPGGCSDYRTHELHQQNVRKLADLHKGFITLKEKNNITGGEFGKRMEALIYWKRAWLSSQGNPLL